MLGDLIAVEVLGAAAQDAQQYQRHQPCIEVLLKLACMALVHAAIVK
jgi:hypothetical protein